MNYTKKSFSVASPGTQTYRDNWERTFRGGDEEKSHKSPEQCSFLFTPTRRTQATFCQLPAGHEGYHVGHANGLELRITQTTNETP